MSRHFRFKIPYLKLCVYCESELADTWDHIIPYSKGGKTSIDNMVPACKRCNAFAHDMLFNSFEEKKLYLKMRSQLHKTPCRKREIYATFLVKIIKTGKIHCRFPEWRREGTRGTSGGRKLGKPTLLKGWSRT